jgi:hypothetical protein
MRIGFCGSGGTGKSTSALKLAEAGLLPYHKGVARIVFADLGLTENDQENMSRAERWKLQKRMFDETLKQDADQPKGVFDRTTLDHLTYCLYRCADQVDDATAKAMMIVVQENMVKYDLLVYFPLYDWDVRPDGLRQNGFAYRLAIDVMIRGLLKELGLTHHRMPNVGPDVRDQLIRSWLKPRPARFLRESERRGLTA